MLTISYLALTLSSVFLVNTFAASIPAVLYSEGQVWQQLMDAKDYAGIAAKYTENCMMILPGKPTVQGRQTVQHLYKDLFDAGMAVNSTGLVDAGALGDKYVFMILTTTVTFPGASDTHNTNFVLFEKVGEEYQSLVNALVPA